MSKNTKLKVIDKVGEIVIEYSNDLTTYLSDESIPLERYRLDIYKKTLRLKQELEKYLNTNL